MSLKKYYFLLFSLLITTVIFGQITQTVRGKVSDKEIGTGLPGVIVQLKSSTSNIAVSTDANGNFKLTGVPTGRQSFQFTFTGYNPVMLNDVIVTSGKEVILNVDMEERAVEMNEVEVKASGDTNVVNTMQ